MTAATPCPSGARGKQPIYLSPGEEPALPPITGSGSGSVRVKEKILLAVIIEKLNELFGADTSEGSPRALGTMGEIEGGGVKWKSEIDCRTL